VRKVIAVGGVALATVSVLLGWKAVAGGAFAAGLRQHVALPPVSASPEQVVLTYLAAADAHDTDTMQALLTPSNHGAMTPSPSSVWDRILGNDESWPGNVRSIRDIRISWSRNDCPAEEQAAKGSCVDVGTEFSFSAYRSSTIEPGLVPWGFWVVRDNVNDRWLIDEVGQG